MQSLSRSALNSSNVFMLLLQTQNVAFYMYAIKFIEGSSLTRVYGIADILKPKIE